MVWCGHFCFILLEFNFKLYYTCFLIEQLNHGKSTKITHIYLHQHQPRSICKFSNILVSLDVLGWPFSSCIILNRPILKWPLAYFAILNWHTFLYFCSRLMNKVSNEISDNVDFENNNIPTSPMYKLIISLCW